MILVPVCEVRRGHYAPGVMVGCRIVWRTGDDLRRGLVIAEDDRFLHVWPDPWWKRTLNRWRGRPW